jgi:hypothetical protein
VIQEQKRSQIFKLSYLSKVAVIFVPSSTINIIYAPEAKELPSKKT